MTRPDDSKGTPAPGKTGQLSFVKIVGFVAALFVVGGLMFLAGRMSGHAPRAISTSAK